MKRQPAYAGAGTAFAWGSWQAAGEVAPTPGSPEAVASTTPAKPATRPRRRWRRILLSAVLLLLLIGLAGGGYLWYRTETTLNEIHSVSTPPPVLSGAALGGDPGLQIKTTTGQATGGPSAPHTQAPVLASAATPPANRPAAATTAEATAPPTKPTETAPAVATKPLQETDGTNILVMGVDARPGEAIDVGVRPDALMVLHLNSDTGTCHILAVPRDTRTMLPGYGMTKVNHALALGGIPFEKSVVEQLLGIKIDHYALIDFTGFQDFVDALGGVTIDVPEAVTIEDHDYAAGPQQFNGQEALAYARYRGGPDGDFGRIQRQQQLIRAIVDKAISGGIITKINSLLPAFAAHVRTDLGPLEMLTLGREYESTCRGEQIKMATLDGTVETLPDPVLNMDLSYVIVDPAEIQRKVAELLAP